MNPADAQRSPTSIPASEKTRRLYLVKQLLGHFNKIERIVKFLEIRVNDYSDGVQSPIFSYKGHDETDRALFRDIRNATFHTENLLISLFQLLLSINTLEEINDLQCKVAKPLPDVWAKGFGPDPRVGLTYVGDKVKSIQKATRGLRPATREALEMEFDSLSLNLSYFEQHHMPRALFFPENVPAMYEGGRKGWFWFEFLMDVIEQCIDLHILFLGSQSGIDEEELGRMIEPLSGCMKVLDEYRGMHYDIVTSFEVKPPRGGPDVGFLSTVVPCASMFEKRRKAGIADPAQLKLIDIVMEAMMLDIRGALITAFGGIEKIEGMRLWSEEEQSMDPEEPPAFEVPEDWQIGFPRNRIVTPAIVEPKRLRSGLGKLRAAIAEKSVKLMQKFGKKKQIEKAVSVEAVPVEAVEVVRKVNVRVKLECVEVMKTRLDWFGLLKFLENLRAESVLARIWRYLEED